MWHAFIQLLVASICFYKVKESMRQRQLRGSVKMATSMSTFRSLGAGIKFDVKRFRTDAEKFKLVKPQKSENISEVMRDGLTTSACDISEKTPGTNEPIFEQNEGVKRKLVDDHPQKKRRKRKKHSGPHSIVSGDTAIKLLSSQINQGDEITAEEDVDTKAEEQQKKIDEELSAIRRNNKIHVTGTDIPPPVSEFVQLQQEYRIHQDIIENIHRLGYVKPTPIQMQAIPVMLHRRELLACAPTGSGKTAAFILPILHQLKEPRNQGFRAIVLSPTRELASQTYREFLRLSEGRGFRIHMVDKFAKASKVFKKQSGLKFDILVATPNRLVYMLQQEPPAIKLNNVEWLIIDESDKLFETGKNGFREQLATIYQSCDSAKTRRALFSATYAHEVENWCKLNLDNVIEVTVGYRNTATELIKQELVFVGGEYGKLLAVREIFRKGFQPPVLIFVQSKERSKELFHELIYDGFNVDVIHADKSQEQRDNVIKSFRAGKIWVLIATELMGRGIDFKGVNLVINYDFPTSAISYIHRIGRTGRAGRSGRAVTLFTEDDAVCLRSIANVMKNAGCNIPDYMLKLKKMTKKEKAKLEKKPIEREPIRTGPYRGKNEKLSSKSTESGQENKEQSKKGLSQQGKLGNKNKSSKKFKMRKQKTPGSLKGERIGGKPKMRGKKQMKKKKGA
ncbi:putative ATP-dependent RNA helicase DDX52 [Holothuria leucospilota]|uniref:Probable ATP-dependent RNA helicase DDX52 n=1 Tax=Holothuria leucospilota TaxID=206669 RepID=A0A9Q1CCU8_HOLLE|nr:putative ATP-dependent RNA helicase DDX52 [Holothuria leucospilota]